MPETSLITDEMRALVGKGSETWAVEVDRSACRLFARAVGHTDPIYYDVEAARAKDLRDVSAPPGFLGRPIFNPGVDSPAEKSAGDLPWETAGLNGGNDFEYFDTVCAGDTLKALRRVVDWNERESRMGRMVILKEDVEYRRDGKLVAVDHQTSLLVAGGKA